MIEMTAKEMARYLRRCGGTLTCEKCPYEHMGTANCIQNMQRDAAAMLDGQQAVIDQQARTLDQIRAAIQCG